MANVNKVILIGNVTRDPEVKFTTKGSAVTELGIAVNRFYTTESGEKREEATFVDVTLWGKTAELAGEFLKKGRAVYIEGRLQMDTWEDKQTGQKRSKLRVVGDSLQFLDRRPGQAGGAEEGNERHGQAGNRPAANRPENSPSHPPADQGEQGDDIPF